jgi:hypothetical protein
VSIKAPATAKRRLQTYSTVPVANVAPERIVGIKKTAPQSWRRTEPIRNRAAHRDEPFEHRMRITIF